MNLSSVSLQGLPAEMLQSIVRHLIVQEAGLGGDYFLHHVLFSMTVTESSEVPLVNCWRY